LESKNIGIRKAEFVAKTQFLLIILNSFYLLIPKSIFFEQRRITIKIIIYNLLNNGLNIRQSISQHQFWNSFALSPGE